MGSENGLVINGSLWRLGKARGSLSRVMNERVIRVGAENFTKKIVEIGL